MEAMGQNNNDVMQNAEEGDADEGGSILHSLRKRIRLGRERQREVGIVIVKLFPIFANIFTPRRLAPVSCLPLRRT